jgi:hypothetical protein
MFVDHEQETDCCTGYTLLSPGTVSDLLQDRERGPVARQSSCLETIRCNASTHPSPSSSRPRTKKRVAARASLCSLHVPFLIRCRTASEGRRLAEQLLAQFATSADPVADAQECVETARLWLKSLKSRSQVSLPRRVRCGFRDYVQSCMCS